MTMAFEVDPTKYLPAWQAQVLLSFYGVEFYEQNDPEYLNDVILPAIAGNPGAFDSNTGQIAWDWWSSGSIETIPGDNYPTPDVHAIPYLTYFLYLDTTRETPNYPGAYFDFNRQYLRPNPADPFDQNGLPDRDAVDMAQYAPSPKFGLKTYLGLLIENLKPHKFNGTIRIQSRDPRVAPIIEENLFEDDAGLRHMAKLALQFRQILADHPDFVNKYGYINEFQPGPLAATEDQLVEYIKLWSAYGHHMCGTCPMGPTDCKGRLKNKDDVLDSSCRVVGVKGLRVADCSVYPTPRTPDKCTFHAYNTSRGAYIVGELVSEFLLEEHDCSKVATKLKPKSASKGGIASKDVIDMLHDSRYAEELRSKIAHILGDFGQVNQ